MPELPEVEASRLFFERHCIGKIIKSVHAQEDEKVFCGHSTRDVHRALQGRRVLSTGRKGKYFWTHLDGVGNQILFHFGMTGHLIVRDHGYAYSDSKDNSWPPRFVKLELTMDDGAQVAFTDARRFARVKLLENPEAQAPVSNLGPDSYTELPPVPEFVAMLAKQRRPVKALLIDQTFLSGIGNWVADEILYQANIYPEARANTVTDSQAVLLHTAIEHVLTVAVKAGARSDEFPPSWLFHYRWTGKVATTHSNGHAVQFLKVGGRTTAYVPALQPKQASDPTDKNLTPKKAGDDGSTSSKVAEDPLTHKKRARPKELKGSRMEKSNNPNGMVGNTPVASATTEGLPTSRPIRKCRLEQSDS